jgi:hypothetical protein
VKDVTGRQARFASTSSSEARSIARAKRSPSRAPQRRPVARVLLVAHRPRTPERSQDSDCAALGGVPVPLLVSFVARQRGQPSRPIAHVDHMRTTSIPSNYLSVTNHLHIRRHLDRRATAAAVRPRRPVAVDAERLCIMQRRGSAPHGVRHVYLCRPTVSSGGPLMVASRSGPELGVRVRVEGQGYVRGRPGLLRHSTRVGYRAGDMMCDGGFRQMGCGRSVFLGRLP